MTERRRLLGLVFVTYAAGRLLSRALIYGTWNLDPELAAQLAIVPLAQIVTLFALRRVIWQAAWRDTPRGRG